MAIPYALKVLENPMRDIAARYGALCQSLGLQGFNRLRVVELRALKRPLAQALAFASCCQLISLNDLNYTVPLTFKEFIGFLYPF